jgi:outer membrane murein-binding lipoprotein Lpp
MRTFVNEMKDGISDAIEKNNSIAFECDIINNESRYSLFVVEQNENNQPSFAFLYDREEKQKDLYYLNAVLVSAGWNKNDDVFGVDELWSARNTPINKQFNYMHDDSDIIGHITGSIVVDHDGNHVTKSSDDAELPEKIDIITSAVIYKTWSDPDMRERIDNLTKEIDEGKWSVSMECIFSNFDYAVIGPDNEQRVLSRTEESSFLTKHLRAYGGTGEYNGYKIGRLLRGFYFSGKGLVAKPANPRSIILNKEVNPFNSKADITFNNFLTAMENHNMSDNTMQIEDLKAQLESTKANFETEKSLIEKQNADKLAEISSANESILSEKDQLIEHLSSKVVELESSIAEMNKDKEKMMKEVEAFKMDMEKKEEELKGMKEKYAGMMKEMKGMKRMASLIEAGADETKAAKIVEDFSDASDEMFQSVVALLADKTPKPEPKPEPEPQPEPAPVDFGSEDAEKDDEEADASELDSVEGLSEASLANPQSDQECQNVAIASAASWLRQSVLKSTKNLK